MTLKNLIDIKHLIIKLNSIKFNDFKIVVDVYKLIKKLRDILDVGQQEINKILDIYALHDKDGKLVINNNQYTFENDEKRNAYVDEMTKLLSSNVDNIEKIDIRLDSIQSFKDISADDIAKLELIINWI